MTIDAKQKELLIKLMGMLGSDFDGERAVAAKKIADAAKWRKVSIPELMRLCFSAEEPAYKTYTPFHEARQRDYSTNTTAGVHRAKLKEMEDLIDTWGVEPLTGWEANFAADLAERRPTFLSEKQEACVDKILAKLKKCGTNVF